MIKALLAQSSDIGVSVSHTTRQQRDGEIDGQHYHFVDTEAFQRSIDDGLFLEHAEIFGHYYGTSRASQHALLDAGTDVILEIDWQGAQQIRHSEPETCSIFILPPSLNALQNRLENRKQDSKEVIERRLSQAREDMSHCNEYDYILINDDFESAVEQLRSIVIAQRSNSQKTAMRYAELVAQLTKAAA